MESNFQKVCEFHRAFGHPYHEQFSPETVQDFNTSKLRIKLIKEEFNEYACAYFVTNRLECLDALADSLYVIYGTGACFGINLDKEYESRYSTELLALEQIFNKRAKLDIKSNFERTVYFMYANMKKEFPYLNYKVIIANNSLKDDKYNHHKVEEDLESLLKELSYGILLVDMKKITEALCNMLFAIYAIGAAEFGVDMNEVFDEVHCSNMSKLCSTEDIAKKTVEHYKKNNAIRYPNVEYRGVPSGDYWIVFDKDTGKILKSIEYVPPVLNGY